MFRLERQPNSLNDLLTQTATTVAGNRASNMMHQKKSKEIADVLGPLNDESSPYDWMRAIQSLRHVEPEEKKQLFHTIEEVNKHKATAKKASHEQILKDRKEAEDKARHRQQGIAELQALGINTNMVERQGENEPGMVGKQGAVTPRPESNQLPGGVGVEDYLNANSAGRKLITSPLRQAGGLGGQATSPESAALQRKILTENPDSLPGEVSLLGAEAGLSRHDQETMAKNRAADIEARTKQGKGDLAEREFSHKLVKESEDVNKPNIEKVTNDYQNWETTSKPIYETMASMDPSKFPSTQLYSFMDRLGIPVGAYIDDPSAENFEKLTQMLSRGVADLGYGKILQVEFENFAKTIPTLKNTPLGRQKIVAGTLKMGEVKGIVYKHMQELRKQYIDQGKPLPRDFREQYLANALPEVRQVAQQAMAIANMPNEKAPEGKALFFNPEGDEIVQVSNDPKSIQKAKDNGYSPTYVASPMNKKQKEVLKKQREAEKKSPVEELPKPFSNIAPVQQAPPIQEEVQELQKQQQTQPQAPEIPPLQEAIQEAQQPQQEQPFTPTGSQPFPGGGVSSEKIQERPNTMVPYNPKEPTSTHGMVELMPVESEEFTPEEQEKVDETWTQYISRNVKGVGYDAGTALLALPADTAKTISDITKSGVELATEPFYRWLFGDQKYEKMKREIDEGDAKAEEYFPTKENIRKVLKYADLNAEEPKTSGEAEIRRVGENVIRAAVNPGRSFGTWLYLTATPAMAAVGKNALQYAGLSEDKALKVEMATNLLLDLASLNPKKAFLDPQLDLARKELATVNLGKKAAYDLESDLKTLLNKKLLSTDPAASVARAQAEEILKSIQESRLKGGAALTGDDLIERYNAMNTATAEAPFRSTATKESAWHKNALVKEKLIDTAKKAAVTPAQQKAASQFKENYASRSVIHQSEGLQRKAAKWIEQYIPGTPGRITGLFSGVGAGSVIGSLVGHGKLAAATGGGAGLAISMAVAGLNKTRQIAHRVIKDENLRKYYFKSINSLIANDSKNFIANYKKLEKLYDSKFSDEKERTTYEEYVP